VGADSPCTKNQYKALSRDTPRSHQISNQGSEFAIFERSETTSDMGDVRDLGDVRDPELNSPTQAQVWGSI